MEGLRSAFVTIVVVLVASLATIPAGAGDDAGMEAWMKAMTPGEPHAGLAEFAGEWSYVVTIWEDPQAEPTRMEGAAFKTMIMGGRFLREELSGAYMGRPFQGFGVTGYDNVSGEYVAIWLDNMSTGINLYTGQQDSRGVQTFTSSSLDPVSGKPIRSRSVGRKVDRDHHTFESFMIGQDGTEQLHMRVEYTRAGS